MTTRRTRLRSRLVLEPLEGRLALSSLTGIDDGDRPRGGRQEAEVRSLGRRADDGPAHDANDDRGGAAVRGSATEVRRAIRLSGAAFNGVVPKGVSESRVRGERSQFKAQVENVNLANGTVLTVKVDGTAVGTLTLVGRRGGLELSSQDGEPVPAIRASSVVSVTTVTGTVVASGKF